MKYLAICIPNYNRLNKLKRLVDTCATQIINNSLEQEVEICISDDCSPEDPSEMINAMRKKYFKVSFRYERNKENKGMDYNFLNSVLISDSLYCWIIGNDDLPEEDAICRMVNYLKEKSNQIDILITPFNVYAENGEYRNTIYPFGDYGNNTMKYDTKNVEEYFSLLNNVQHNSALFGFLSNVVFKRQNWERYKVRFQDKLNTIFIQMYMNIQTLKDGATVEYVPWKIICNYADDKTNESITRVCKILFGLDGVVEYFFDGKEKEYLKRVIVDNYISGIVWELPESHLYKKKVREIVSGKNQIYEKFFVPCDRRKEFFSGKRVLIYGAGIYGRKSYKELKEYGAILEGIADSDSAKTGLAFEEFAIMSVIDMIDICHKKEVYVVVASHLGLETMVHTLVEQKIMTIAVIN